MTLMFMGALADSRHHLEQSLALYDARHYHSNAFLTGMDSQVSCLVFASLVLWSLGYPVQALHRSHEALQLAHELAHLPTVSHALYVSSILQQSARVWQTAQGLVKAAISLASEHGFILSLARQMVVYGWTLVMQGHKEEGLRQIRQGLIGDAKTAAQLGRPWQLALLAEAYGTMGEVAQGLATLAEALTLIHTNGEHWYEAELYRLKGELLLQQSPDNATEAATCFHKAIDVACSQQAKSWELRAATSLARLWKNQGKREEARELLEPVYGWFTEGFDTADLQDAKSLLDALS